MFNDPRRFGYMKIIARNALEDEPLLKGLGPEPLGNEFDAAMLARACANKKTSLKAALLDQRVVAGLGNIYVCEALYRSHLSPRRLAATLATKKGEPTDHAKRLVDAIHAVLNQAIKAGGSSLRDHRQTSGELGYFQHSFQVYDREGEKCQTPAAAASCGASPRTAVRPSGARNARSDARHVAWPANAQHPAPCYRRMAVLCRFADDACRRAPRLRPDRSSLTLRMRQAGRDAPVDAGRVGNDARGACRNLGVDDRLHRRRLAGAAISSRVSTHCQRPRISSADLPPGANSLTARPARSASW